MANIAVEKSVCGACKAKLREGSVFCYNCGRPISPPNAEQRETRVDNRSTAGSNEIYANKSDSVRAGLEAGVSTARGNSNSGALEIAPTPTQTNLQSASALKRTTNVFKREPIEVVWVERENSPRAFIIVSVALALFAGILLFLALYFR